MVEQNGSGVRIKALVVVAGVMALAAGCSGAPDPSGAESTGNGAAASAPDAVVAPEPAAGSAGEPSSSTAAAGAADDRLADSIDCTTQYRPDAETLEGAEEPTLSVRPSGSLTGERETLTFPTMELEVTAFGAVPDGAGSVSVVVRSSTGEELVRTLYQLGSVPFADVDFGGLGFTGLQYVTHGPAQLQVTCSAT
jgi:hypothetical protein